MQLLAASIWRCGCPIRGPLPSAAVMTNSPTGLMFTIRAARYQVGIMSTSWKAVALDVSRKPVTGPRQTLTIASKIAEVSAPRPAGNLGRLVTTPRPCVRCRPEPVVQISWRDRLILTEAASRLLRADHRERGSQSVVQLVASLIHLLSPHKPPSRMLVMLEVGCELRRQPRRAILCVEAVFI